MGCAYTHDPGRPPSAIGVLSFFFSDLLPSPAWTGGACVLQSVLPFLSFAFPFGRSRHAASSLTNHLPLKV